MAGTVDLGACVSYGFESVKKNIGFHVVAVVILMIINSFTAGILGGPFLLGYFKALEKADRESLLRSEISLAALIDSCRLSW